MGGPLLCFEPPAVIRTACCAQTCLPCLLLLQLEFAGLKDTRATYQDKVRIMQQLRSHYNLPYHAPPGTVTSPRKEQ